LRLAAHACEVARWRCASCSGSCNLARDSTWYVVTARWRAGSNPRGPGQVPTSDRSLAARDESSEVREKPASRILRDTAYSPRLTAACLPCQACSAPPRSITRRPTASVTNMKPSIRGPAPVVGMSCQSGERRASHMATSVEYEGMKWRAGPTSLILSDRRDKKGADQCTRLAT